MFLCNHISFQRSGKPLFHNIGFCTFPGSLILIKGRNGSGKTTLLKILAGFLNSKGEVYFDGKDLATPSAYMQNVCHIGSSDVLDENFTVLENIMFWSGIYDQDIKVPASLHTLGLNSLKNTMVCDLSKGEKQRVLLTLLLISNAKLWLLDEPFEGLDEKYREHLINIIKSRCANKGIVILSTHDRFLDDVASSVINIEDFHVKN